MPARTTPNIFVRRISGMHLAYLHAIKSAHHIVQVLFTYPESSRYNKPIPSTNNIERPVVCFAHRVFAASRPAAGQVPDPLKSKVFGDSFETKSYPRLRQPVARRGRSRSQDPHPAAGSNGPGNSRTQSVTRRGGSNGSPQRDQSFRHRPSSTFLTAVLPLRLSR